MFQFLGSNFCGATVLSRGQVKLALAQLDSLVDPTPLQLGFVVQFIDHLFLLETRGWQLDAANFEAQLKTYETQEYLFDLRTQFYKCPAMYFDFAKNNMYVELGIGMCGMIRARILQHAGEGGEEG